MKISTKGRYAVRLMYDLAMHHTGDWIALKDISRRQEISVKYLEQIVRQLSIRGYLKSLRGPKGGYQLSRDPKDYTIYEILKITEGSLQPVACLDDKVNQCERYHECPTIEIWEGLGQVIEEYLSGITLEDVVNKARIKEQVKYYTRSGCSHRNYKPERDNDHLICDTVFCASCWIISI